MKGLVTPWLWRLLPIVLFVAAWVLWSTPRSTTAIPPDREEVVFWHFWGGADREIVESVVARFNRKQQRYFVRPIAMPGNNLDLKLFLSITGGDPPDLVNQDDPIMAEWASRGALLPLDEVASADELAQLDQQLVPAAQQLGKYGGRYYALCNGLDIRALYYNRTILDELGLPPPETLAELDQIALAGTQFDEDGRPTRFGYLPDPRRLWAWGVTFGGKFYDASSGEVTVDSPQVVAALDWMASYRDRFGARHLAAFRQGDQSLPGKVFPLLANRYVVVMDGQWRVRDIAAAQQAAAERGETIDEYGVCPLPPPPGGHRDAGWANGNFFLVPKHADSPRGAWEFMKFWCGLDGQAAEAAETCIAGGWIPVTHEVIVEPSFQNYLQRQSLMATFVRLAQSPHQVPTPVIPGAAFFQRTVNDAAATTLYVPEAPLPSQVLQQADRSVETHLRTKTRP